MEDPSRLDVKEKGDIALEATASEQPPLEDSEPPSLEEESEPHSKANTSPLSSPISPDVEKGSSSSSDTEHIDAIRDEHLPTNSASLQNENSPVHTNSDATPPITGIGSNTGTAPREKVEVKSSIRSSIPAITHSVISAAKQVSFKTRSLSSRSSPIYGSKYRWKGTARQMKIVEVVLRFGGAVLALVTFSVMAATSEVRSGAGSTFKMKFTDYQAYNYLVALNVISFVYSCLQLILLGRLSVGGIFYNTHDNVLVVYIFDQVLAFLLFSASTAAATAAQLSRHGLHNLWPPACSTWKLWLFCSKADAAVAMSFFSSFFVIASSVFSGYQLSHSLAG